MALVERMLASPALPARHQPPAISTAASQCQNVHHPHHRRVSKATSTSMNLSLEMAGQSPFADVLDPQLENGKTRDP